MNRGSISISLALFFLVAGIIVIGSCSPNKSTIRAVQETRAGCTGCHHKGISGASLDWSIHLDHYSNPEFMGDCWSCHLINEEVDFGLVEAAEERRLIKVTKDVVEHVIPYFRSWATSNHLDHLHARQNVTCVDCHGTFFPKQRFAAEKCLKCHGSYQDSLALTKDVNPNPHNSHFGKMRCIRCHMAHEKSALYCNKCHVFDLEVP